VSDPEVELVALLDIYDRMVADAASHLPPEIVEPVASIGRAVRTKRALVGEVTLVGLLGGTGSGKSSLLNALAGVEVSPAGARRPTTSKTVAWIPANGGTALEAVLEVLGIEHRVDHDGAIPLAVLDLPDIDSLVTQHRQLVAEVVPYLDLVLWVIDPEKYHDRILHEMIRSSTRHQEIFRFVLNQIDRIDPFDLVPLAADLQWTLRSDGIRNPIIWTAAADPPIGPSVGVDEIWVHLLEIRSTGLRRELEMVNELAIGAALLAPHLESVDFSRRWEGVVARVGDLVARGRTAEAEQELWMLAHDLFPGVSFDLAAAVGEAAASSEPSRALDATVGRELRDRLRPRARTRALLTEFELALQDGGLTRRRGNDHLQSPGLEDGAGP